MTAFERAWGLMKMPLSEGIKQEMEEGGASEQTINFYDQIIDEPRETMDDISFEAFNSPFTTQQILEKIPLHFMEEGGWGEGYIDPIRTKDKQLLSLFIEDWLSECVPKSIRGTGGEEDYKIESFKQQRKDKHPGEGWEEVFSHHDPNIGMRMGWLKNDRI